MPPLMPSHADADLLPGARQLLAAKASLAAARTGTAIAIAQAHELPVPEGVRAAERALACWAHTLDRSPDREGRP